MTPQEALAEIRLRKIDEFEKKHGRIPNRDEREVIAMEAMKEARIPPSPPRPDGPLL